MSLKRSHLVAIMTLFIFAFFGLVSMAFAELREDAVALGLTGAEETVVLAYESVQKAEQAGADVSGLLVKLNNAGELLAEAQVAYRLGNFDEAVRLAGLCSEIGEHVKSEANELWVRAYGSRIVGFTLTMTGSLIGVATVGLGSLWGWHVFKRRYHRRVSRMKPVVNSDESQ